MPVDTGKVHDRRKVAYASLEDVLADAERLSHAPVKTLGNWSPGQIFTHLARTMNESIDGSDLKVAWYIRLIVGFMKKKLLAGPMRAGFKLPADAEKSLWPGPTSIEEGLAALQSGGHAVAARRKTCPQPGPGADDQGRVEPAPPEPRGLAHELPGAAELTRPSCTLGRARRAEHNGEGARRLGLTTLIADVVRFRRVGAAASRSTE